MGYHKCSTLTLLSLTALTVVFMLRGSFISKHSIYLQCTISTLIPLHLISSIYLASSTGVRFTARRVAKVATLFVFTIAIYHLTLILFGAKFTSEVGDTLHLATLLACLTTLPYLLFISKLDLHSAARLFILFEPSDGNEQALLTSALACLVGVWLGAWPIPLDWDRPWQTWPITCTIGAVCGYAVGAIINIGRKVISSSPTITTSQSASSSSSSKISDKKRKFNQSKHKFV